MKKTYQTPETNMTLVAQQLLQSASLGKNNSTTVSDNSIILSRGGSGLWDDDED